MMNIYRGVLLILMIFLFGMFSCEEIMNCVDGTEEVKSRQIDLQSFEGITIANEADLVITQGNEQIVEVESHDNIINNLDLQVSNEILTIGNERCVQDYDVFRIYITLPYLNEVNISGSSDVDLGTFDNFDDLSISISGSGDLSSKGRTLGVEDLKLSISGSGDVDLSTQANLIRCDGISGSGDIYLAGSATSQEVNISGSGNYKAFNLVSARTEVKLTGSGDCEVYVTDQLKVQLSGSGDVYYKGNPIIQSDISGSGELIDAN